MKKWGFIVLLTIVVLGVTAVFYRAESGDVNKEKVHLFSPYASSVDIYQITYPSDGLQVKGFYYSQKTLWIKNIHC